MFNKNTNSDNWRAPRKAIGPPSIGFMFKINQRSNDHHRTRWIEASDEIEALKLAQELWPDPGIIWIDKVVETTAKDIKQWYKDYADIDLPEN